LWVFGEGGLTRLNGVGAEIPGAAITGMSVLGIATRGEVHYLITDEGVRRLDAAGRLYPTSAALLNGAARAIVGPTDEADPFWLATAGGAVALDGYFASFPAADLPQGCVRDSARFNGALWLATSAGLFRGVGDAFEATPPADLPSPDARVIRQVGEEIWVGTNAGVARFDVTGLALGQITAADGIPNMPVSDALRTTRYTWLSTLGGGLARQPLDPPDAPWEIFNSASGLPNYTSDQIRALAFDGQRLWAGTLAGLMIFDEETDSFLFPISEVGARLPNNSVNDVLIFDGQVFAATDGGVALQTPEWAWTAIQRVSQDVPNIPLEAGTDFARALSEDGEYVWILLNPGRGQDFGGLVRWSPSAPATLFTAADAGLLETQALDGAALRSLDGELFISYCGVDGGLTLLDGAGVVAARVKEGLPGDGAYAAMTESAGGGLLFASEIEDQRWVFELRDGALSPLSLPASITALPVDCAMPLEGAQLWCILDGYGVARYIPNPDPQRPGTWSPFELSGTTPTCVAAQSPTVAWVGTTTGITLIDGPQINRINSAMTGGGLPGDEIRQLKLSPQRRLYAATQAGVGIYDLDANSWTALTEGIDLDVYAVAPSPTDPSFWVGTARGLFHVVAGQPPRPLTEAQGAPTVAVYDLEIDAAGQVFAATELGLLRGSPDGAFELLGFNDGLPGRRALELVLTADGDVWVRSDDGLARLR
ncbi:hypothetical protein KKB55_20705, partial [Myxococcota bacterium]|nr:hypothetical protein [Myxococcota bacterium]